MTRPKDRAGPTFRDVARHYLGLDEIDKLLTKLERRMATAAEQLTELQAAFTDFSADVDAKLDQLLAAQGQLDPAAQQVFDELKQAVQDADASVGDADGSDTPPPPPPGDGERTF